jgi:SAM-dependent methyltransferase
MKVQDEKMDRNRSAVQGQSADQGQSAVQDLNSEPRFYNDQAARAMAGFGELLDSIDYADLHRAVMGHPLIAPDPSVSRWRAMQLPPLERSILIGYGFGDCIIEEWADSRSKAVADEFVESAIASVDDQGWQTNGWIVVPYDGGYLLVDRFVLYGGSDTRVYLGNDSLMLANVIRRRRGARMLDLGAGSGVHGLLCASSDSLATLADIDWRAVDFCRLNEALNRATGRVSHPVRVLQGDLFMPVRGEKFDLVVSLPPYVPSLHEGQLYRFADGGEDGASVVKRILEEAPDRLSEQGELLILVQAMMDQEGRPLFYESLRYSERTNLDIRMTTFDLHYLWPYAVELAGEMVGMLGGDEQAQRRMAEDMVYSWRSNGAYCVGSILLRARHGQSLNQITAIHTEPIWSYYDVPRLAGARLVQSSDHFTLTAADGRITVLDPSMVNLIQQFDGSRSLYDAVSVAWPESSSGAGMSLMDVAMEKCGELERAGMLSRGEYRR